MGTDEAVPRIEFDFTDVGREEDQALPIPSLNAVDVGSESLSATLCPTKALSEYLVETILAFVEALGHNVVMLHSDQQPVLVQLLKAVAEQTSQANAGGDVAREPSIRVKARLRTRTE